MPYGIAATFDPEALTFFMSSPSPVLSMSSSSEYIGSTFSETVTSNSTMFDDTPLAPSKPRVKFPPASPYVSPTYEEEAALFESADAPRIGLSSFTPVFNMAATATAARQKLTISFKRDFPEDEARPEREELFDEVIRICLPPRQSNDVPPTVEEERDLFTDVTAPVIRLPLITATVHTQVTRPAARETNSICYNNPPEVKARAEVENELFDKVIRVNLPAPQYIDIAHTVEEEKELFAPMTAPIIQLPSFGSNLNTEAIASAARKAVSTFSCRDFPQVITREEPGVLDDGLVRICMPCTALELLDKKALSAPKDERDEAPTTITEPTIAPERSTITSQKLSSQLNPEAWSFVPKEQLDLKVCSSRYPDAKLNPCALSFVPEIKHLNPEAAEFVPETKFAGSILNPQAPVFRPDQCPAMKFETASFRCDLNAEAAAVVPTFSSACNAQPLVLGYTVGASDFVPVATSSMNPEAPLFYPGEQQQTLFNPEAEEFVPAPNPAQYLQDARSTLPNLGIQTTVLSITPQCYEDRREAWLTEEFYNYGLDNFGEGIAVHHYSFIGHPVMCRTSTPPATSLAIISGEPKLKEGYMLNQDNLHRHTMLYNAMHLVDPVVYRGSADLLYDLKGTDLENAAIGLVNKAYSRHGWWQEDHYDDYDDVPEYDPLNVHQYDEDEMYFNATSRLYYLEQPQPQKDADDSAHEALRKQTRRGNFTHVKSPLSQVMSADEEDDAQVDDHFVVLNRGESVVAEVKSASSMHTETAEPVDAVEHELLINDKVATGQREAEPLALDPEKELASDAESIGTIHPECAISPLKIRKVSIHPTELVDNSLAISPLKARKPSDESTSSGHADQFPIENTSDESGTSTPATTDSDKCPAETSPLLAGSGPSAYGSSETDNEREHSPTTSPKHTTSRAIVRRPASLAIASNQGMEAGGRSIPIASALRPNRSGRPRNSGDSFGPLQDVATRLNHYLIRNDHPWDPLDPSIYARSGIPRSPECYNLKGAAARPDLVRGDEYKILVLRDPLLVVEELAEKEPADVPVLSEQSDQAQSNVSVFIKDSIIEDDKIEVVQPYAAQTHMPHQLSPIKEVSEDSPSKAFFRGDTKSIKEIGEVGGRSAEESTPSESSGSPMQPRTLRLKRYATLSDLRGVAQAQGDVTRTPEMLTTPPGSPARDNSPIKGPSAPTPSRMQRLPEPESDDEDEDTRDSVSEEPNEPLTSPTSEDSLVDEPRADSVVSGCESIIRSPKGKQRVFEPRLDNEASSSHLPAAPTTRESAALLRLYMSSSKPEHFEGLGTSASPSPLPKAKDVFGPRVSSGTWLSGKAIQGPAPQADSDSDEAPRPFMPPSTTNTAEPVTPRQLAVLCATPEAAPLSRIGLALPYHPPQPTIAEPCISLHNAPGTVYVASPARFGSSVQAFFNHNEPVEPSPSRSVMDRVFKDFSGFHSAALDFGDFSIDFAEHVMEEMASTGIVVSPIRSRPTSHRTERLTEGVPLSEDDAATTSSPASVASTCSSNASITSNETVIHTWQHERKQAQLSQTPSARDVLFNRVKRAHGSVRPNLSSSSWAKVGNKLRKKSGGSTIMGSGAFDNGVATGVAHSQVKKDDKKEMGKGRFAKWVDRVFGRGKGKQ